MKSYKFESNKLNSKNKFYVEVSYNNKKLNLTIVVLEV